MDMGKNAVIRSMADIPLNKRRKLVLGSLLVKLFPGRARKLEKNTVNQYWGAFDRLLRNGLTAQAFRDGDHARQRSLFAHYWAQEASNVEHVWEARFEREFLEHNVVLIDALEGAIKGRLVERLYEIGCGHGHVLEYLSKRIAGVEEFCGIDISEEQILKNQSNYDNAKLSFKAADAVEWIPRHAKPRSIFLTNGGVFEYFLQEELELIFNHIAQNLAPAIVGVIETIGVDHNLEIEKETLIYGREMAFSHNYPHLLEQAGFEVTHHSEQAGSQTHGGGRWIRVLAVKE